MDPEDISYQYLREITDGFSEERKLGQGAFGVVYKVRPRLVPKKFPTVSITSNFRTHAWSIKCS